MKTTAEKDALDYGYIKSPNSKTEWYAGSAGLLAPCRPFHVHIENTENVQSNKQQDLWPIALRCYIYGGGSVLCARFATWENFLSFVKRMSNISEPGLPAFMYGD